MNLLRIAIAISLSSTAFALLQNTPSPAKAPARVSLAKLVPLFDSKTKLEPATVEETPEAIITRLADRVRDRHAREARFHSYDHYLPFYFEKRTVSIEIVDRVAKGGDSVTYNVEALAPLDGPNLRAFFAGNNTVAEYSSNLIAKETAPLTYSVTLKYNSKERRRLRIGDRIEIEFSPFLKPPIRGRTNYYGTPILYVVGQGGIVPWEGRGPRRDSFPLPEVAWSGGRTTLHQHFSNEPQHRFKQMATNLAPINGQPFVLGRRLHHTDFGNGRHSERGNPVYKEQAGKLGPHYNARSCVACHINNGRALPPKVGSTLTRYLVRVGSDAKGSPHPKLGSTLQSRNTEGEAEAGVTLAGWTETKGTFADGSEFELRRPKYEFSGVTPKFFSIRIAPPLVGQGLLEAIPEDAVVGQDRSKGHAQLANDPETGQLRMGRFGWKAGQARLTHQIASALNNDMGVTSPIYPKLDRGPNQPVELSRDDLDKMYRYVATLGVPARRDFGDAAVLRGEKLFEKVGCATCHTPTLKTSPYHPLAELREQTIHPYTDLLLHDMGPGLADNMGEANATGSEWRTTPLWGIGLTEGVSGGEAYLHDGRARSLSEAILWHGGEGKPAREAFRTMPASDRKALLAFLRSL